MKIKVSIICFLIALSFSHLAGQMYVNVNHPLPESFLNAAPAKYLFGNEVSLRKGPSVKEGLVAILPIGSKCEILTVNDSVQIINGVISNWYKIKTGNHTGWVWGGFIAHEIFGSNADPEVKFLLGFSHVDTTNEYPLAFVQIRVIKDNKLIDTANCAMPASYFYSAFHGALGVPGIHDILKVHQPCEGGCGCSGANTYYFWDGVKLRYALETGGIADAEFSEGSGVYFPSDPDGEKGYIIIHADFVGNYDYNNGKDIMQRDFTMDYYVWTGKKLEKATDKKSRKWSKYYNMETNKMVDKPDDAE